ncbi:acyl-CoA dehydrogenase [Pendulispora rubella]|uniref:Acyl-CoA dehydrogenase n=1 Tax=Pendulispora rubella TaxID=2741070 RepID=A0ABZ2L9Z0_9BACT
MRYRPFELVEDLERFLGDPADPDTSFSFKTIAQLDAAEHFPDAICSSLEDWGLHRYYVPSIHGGALADYQEPLHLLRAISRRDLTVAIGHAKTFLGGVCAWTSATPTQASRLAESVLQRSPVSWGLTERNHGSDLLANEVTATREPGGYVVRGEKWLINNATRGDIISLLVRTTPAGGSRGFDVLMVDKRRLREGSYRCLPKVPTHGIRGADISGIVFDEAFVDDDALIGHAGKGVDVVLKSLQLTRILCCSLSLGASDHALRLATRFASERRLYGRRLIELPRARRILANAYADHLLCEALAVVAARSIHVLTPELSVLSAVAKYLVPTRTDTTIGELARFIGARSVLADVFAEGMFQKVQRDHRVVGLFDGNTLVNLNSLITQFPALSRAAQQHAPAGDLHGLFDLTAPLPPFDRSQLSLLSVRGSRLLDSLPGSMEALEQSLRTDDGLAPLAVLCRALGEHTRQLLMTMATLRPLALAVPAEAFDLAHQLSLCVAGAAAIGLWLGSREHMADDSANSGLWQQGGWLLSVIGRILTALGVHVPPHDATDDILLSALTSQSLSGQMLSMLPCRLAEGMKFS